MSMYYPLEDNQGDILDTFKFRESVARPNFVDMHMSLEGTLLFADCSPKLIIDDRTLETGLCLWVQYETDGRRERAWRVQMFTEEFPHNFRSIHPNSDPMGNILVYMEDRMNLGGEDLHPDVILEDDP